MNEAFRDIFTDKRKFFVVLMIVVPFIAYSTYYYAIIIKDAPFKSAEFEYLEFKKFKNGELREYINTKTGEYTFYTTKDSLVHHQITFSNASLHEMHMTMMDILFWNIETVSGDSTMKTLKKIPLYYVKAVYKHKSKTVWYQQYYFENMKLDNRMAQLIRTIEKEAGDTLDQPK